MNEKIKFELDSLIKQINTIKYLHCVESKLEFDGDESLYEDVLIDYQQNVISISELYNSFYTKAVALLSVILPNRLDEFKSCYIYDSKSPVHITHNRTIANFFNKINYIKNPYEEIFEKQVLTFFILQENILKSAEELIDSVLYELENKIQYNFFMDELHCAEELLKKKYVRPAGVIAGVALESHLKTVCKNHNIVLKPKDTLGNGDKYVGIKVVPNPSALDKGVKEVFIHDFLIKSINLLVITTSDMYELILKCTKIEQQNGGV